MLESGLSRVLSVLLCLALTAQPAQPGTAGKRVALVIGNNAYRHSTQLKNCANDAKAMGEALQSVGFEVKTVLDAERAAFSQGFSWLETQAKDAELGLVYYSGQGVQAAGVNYLVPVDANPKTNADIKRDCVDATNIASDLQDSGCKTSVLILDACRNSPFDRGFRGASSRGLAALQASDDSLIAFAADAGQVADDNAAGENGLYTQELLKHLRTPGILIEEVFKRTRTEVKRKSGKRQVPAEYSKLEGTIVLVPATEPGPAAPASVAAPAEAAAPEEDPQAQYVRAQSYKGRDAAEEAKWYRKAADRGHAGAQCALGFSYANGSGVAKDPTEAVTWYRKAADQGFARAQSNLGVSYETGSGVAKDPTEAVTWFRKAADQGFARAQANLGVCYAIGSGVAKDLTEAVTWFRKAANQGDDTAQYNLGRCYAIGSGVAKDPTEAVTWYRKAVDQGNANAQYALGVCYETGSGVAKDPTEAVTWYRKAVDQGDANAQYSLGRCYAIGSGVAKDLTEAVTWFRKAANQGDDTAQFNLGRCYATGSGVAKDPTEAVTWYRKAADQGQATAQFNLGISYAAGSGVAKDHAQAVKWMRKAAQNGDEDARKWLKQRRLKW